MTATIDYLANAGGPLLLGATAILLTGWLGARFQKAPIARQRFGEWAMFAALLWLLTPLMPFERSHSGSSPPADRHEIVSNRVAADPVHPGRLSGQPALPAESPDESKNRLAEQPVLPLGRSTILDSHIRLSGSAMATGRIPPSISRQSDSDDSAAKSAVVSSTRPGSPTNAPIALPDSNPGIRVVPQLSGAIPAVRAEISASQSARLAGEPDFRTSLSASEMAPGFQLPVKAIVVVYLAGAFVSTAWLLLGQLLLTRLVQNSHPLPDKFRLQLAIQDLPKNTRVVVSPGCRRIFSFGVLVPTIVVPEAMLLVDGGSRMKHVLLHEAGHVLQRDAAGQLLMNLAFVFFWFHPLYWMLRSNICFARELVIDDWAASRSDKSTYVSDMIALARLQPVVVSGPAVAMGAFGFPPSLFFRRIKMLVQRQTRLETRMTIRRSALQGFVILAALVMTIAVVQVPSAVAQQAGDRVAELEAVNKKLEKQTEALSAQLAQAQAGLARMEQLANELEARLADSNARMKHESDLRQLQMAEMQHQLAASHVVQADQQRQQRNDMARDPAGQAGKTSQQAELQQRQQTFEKHMAELQSRHASQMADLHREFEREMAQLHENHAGHQVLHDAHPPHEARHEIHVVPDVVHEVHPAPDARPNPKRNEKPDPGRTLINDIPRQPDLPHEETPNVQTKTGSFGDNDLFQFATALADVQAEREMLIIEMEGLAGGDRESELARRLTETRIVSLNRKSELLRDLARHQLRSLEMSLQREHQKLAQAEKLVERGFVPQSEIDDGRFRVETIVSQIEILNKILKQ